MSVTWMASTFYQTYEVLRKQENRSNHHDHGEEQLEPPCGKAVASHIRVSKPFSKRIWIVFATPNHHQHSGHDRNPANLHFESILRVFRRGGAAAARRGHFLQSGYLDLYIT